MYAVDFMLVVMVAWNNLPTNLLTNISGEYRRRKSNNPLNFFYLFHYTKKSASLFTRKRVAISLVKIITKIIFFFFKTNFNK